MSRRATTAMPRLDVLALESDDHYDEDDSPLQLKKPNSARESGMKRSQSTHQQLSNSFGSSWSPSVPSSPHRLGASQQSVSTARPATDSDSSASTVRLDIGRVVMVKRRNQSSGKWVMQLGIVSWVGVPKFERPGDPEDKWVGLDLTKPDGMNDGSVEGVRYFSCKPKNGIFVRDLMVRNVPKIHEQVVRDWTNRYLLKEKPPRPSTSIRHEGMLERERLNGSWAHRWFVVHDGWLGYYHSQKESQGKKAARGAVKLVDCLVGMSNRKKNCFAITTPRQTFYLRASHSGDLQKWTDAIESCIMYRKTDNPLHKSNRIISGAQKSPRRSPVKTPQSSRRSGSTTSRSRTISTDGQTYSETATASASELLSRLFDSSGEYANEFYDVVAGGRPREVQKKFRAHAIECGLGDIFDLSSWALRLAYCPPNDPPQRGFGAAIASYTYSTYIKSRLVTLPDGIVEDLQKLFESEEFVNAPFSQRSRFIGPWARSLGVERTGFLDVLAPAVSVHLSRIQALFSLFMERHPLDAEGMAARSRPMPVKNKRLEAVKGDTAASGGGGGGGKKDSNGKRSKSRINLSKIIY